METGKQSSTQGNPAAGGDQSADAGTDGPPHVVDAVESELLVEEISIDGMCGVY